MLLLKQVLFNPNAADDMEEMTMYQDRQAFPVEIINEQDLIRIDEKQIQLICSRIISDAGFRTGRLGVVLTDNRTVLELNRTYLGHDYVTDVISFTLEYDETHLEAEVVVSAEIALERCVEFDWVDEAELMLYVVHGTLHQVGYDDKTEKDARLMRQTEAAYLDSIGIHIPDQI